MPGPFRSRAANRAGLVLLALALFVAAGCSDDETPQTSGQGSTSSVPTSIDSPPSSESAVATSVPLPTSVESPPDGVGVPFQSAMQFGAPGHTSLVENDYTEAEYIVAGEANVYDYGPDGSVEVDQDDVSYATRILVRRPRDPDRFSGRVQVETSHPQYGITVVWSQIYEYVTGNGDAYVAVSTRRTNDGSSAIEGLKGFDPERYEQIDFAEDGLNWDVISQVGALLKSDSSDNPLRDLEVDHLYASGWSGGGALLLLYLSDGFHDRARLGDGAPIYDGYLVGEPSGYPGINSTAPGLADTDDRQRVQPRDVPAISLHSRPQEEYRRRADSDDSDDRYRVYEVAGASHADARTIASIDCTYEINAFPMHHLFQSTLERLHRWAADGVTPPPSEHLTVEDDGSVALDDHGNPLGGVRTSHVEVPTHRYFSENTGGPLCSRFGGQEPLGAEQLADLYDSHDDYVQQVVAVVENLESQGWLLPADADATQDEARAADVP